MSDEQDCDFGYFPIMIPVVEGKMTIKEMVKILIESSRQHIEDAIEFNNKFSKSDDLLVYQHAANKAMNDCDFCLTVFESVSHLIDTCGDKESPYNISDLVNRGFIPYEVIGKYDLVGA
jgi:hypothetical protein